MFVESIFKKTSYSFRFIRFRWRYPKSSASVPWAIKDFDIQPSFFSSSTFGLVFTYQSYQSLIYTISNIIILKNIAHSNIDWDLMLIISIWPQASFKDDFNSDVLNEQYWDYLNGGAIVLPNQRLGDGAAASFHDVGLRLLQTVPIDLRFGQNIQFIILFLDSRYNNLLQNVYLQCSIDYGNIIWLSEYLRLQ